MDREGPESERGAIEDAGSEALSDDGVDGTKSENDEGGASGACGSAKSDEGSGEEGTEPPVPRLLHSALFCLSCFCFARLALQ